MTNKILIEILGDKIICIVHGEPIEGLNITKVVKGNFHRQNCQYCLSIKYAIQSRRKQSSCNLSKSML